MKSVDKENKMSKTLEYAIKIKDWCEKHYGDKPIEERFLPSRGYKDKEEDDLGKGLEYIGTRILKKYKDKSIEEIENEEHKQIVEIIRTLRKEYGISTYLRNAIRIQKWCEKHYGDKPREERKMPSKSTKDEEEKKLGTELSSIRQVIIRKYEGIKLEKIQDEDHREIVAIIRTLDRQYGLSGSLKNAIKIRKWCERQFDGKPYEERRLPTKDGSNQEEKMLYRALASIRTQIMGKYEGVKICKIKNEDDKEIVKTIRSLEKKYGGSKVLKNAIRIKKWCKNNFGDKPREERRIPSRFRKDEEEMKLGTELTAIRDHIERLYYGKSFSEIENEEHRKIIEIIRELEENYMSKHQKNLRDGKIKKRMKKAIGKQISSNENTRAELEEISKVEVDKKTGYPDSPEDK